MSPQPGKVIGGKYQLAHLAGEGGMASVWRATQKGAAGFSRTVALKMVRAEFKADKDYIAMFIEEARVGSELQHANIVQVHDFGVDDEHHHYLVMEWIEGMSLSNWIHAHVAVGIRTPWTLVAALGIEALRGLGAAHTRMKDGHAAPIIHRDVSPENILLGANGVVKLSDFGLARAKDRASRLTKPGTIKGKISYLAPEQTVGHPASPQSDIFSTGVVLWEALAGRKLFEGDYLEKFRKIMQAQIMPLVDFRPDIPKDMIEVVHGALKADPRNRFQSAHALANALAAVLRTVPRISDGFLGGSVVEARNRLNRAHAAAQMGVSVQIDVEPPPPPEPTANMRKHR